MALISPPPQPAARKPASLRLEPPARADIALASLTPNNIHQLRKLNAVLFPVRYSQKWYADVLAPEVRELNRFALFNDIPVGNLCARFERIDGGNEAKGTAEVDVYIMTLGVLAPYRRLGIATKLLLHLLSPSAAAPGIDVELADLSAPTPKAAPPASSSTKSAPTPPPSNSETPTTTTASADGLPTTASAASAAKAYASHTKQRRRVRRVYLHVQTDNADARAFYERHGFTLRRTVDEYYRRGIEPRSAWELEKLA